MANVFALPLGVDFAAAFVDGLLNRYSGQPPEALARATIHTNSKRMQTRIRAALIARGVHLLPRLRLVSDLADDLILADLPPAVPALRRRLQLTQLIRALMQAQPGLAPASAQQDLTESLHALIEEMDSEGLRPSALSDLDVSEHSAHWSRSLAFLRILVPFFAEGAPRGQGARRRRAAERLAELWAATPTQDAVIVAGSTASRGEISVFMEAVARLPHGAVVLPGFDFDLPAPVWAAMDDVLTSEDHPQFRFLRLLDRLDLTPEDVRRWHDCAPADPARNRLLSLALRPAPVTDQWLADGAAFHDLRQDLAGVTLIEAASPREEAQAIALVLRDAAERGAKAALITPDRLLGRRVVAALDRWRIRPDDSAGRPLALSAPGRFLRHLADLATERLTAARLLILLKHPLVMSGEGRGPHLRLTRELELRLRRYGPVFPEPADLTRFAESQTDAGPWAEALGQALAQIEASRARQPLADHVAGHRKLAEDLARGMAPTGSGTLWLENAGEACLALLETLSAEAAFGGEMTAHEYRDLFTAVLMEQSAQDPAPTHADIQILGAREARECGADLVILAGLNEGSWPPTTAPDPWLNRAMRKAAGLLLPERQIGLTAHDFQQAAASPQVVFSRAKRSDEAETVAARWLNRITNLVDGLPGAGGPEALQAMRARGRVWLDMAARLDLPGPAELADPRLQPALRPKPVPPLAARPVELSLTEIETLIRDPYAIYARRILRLTPLDPLAAEPDAGERGTLLHKILERFVTERPKTPEDLDQARDRFLATAGTLLAQEMPFPTHRAVWLARLTLAADAILAEDRRLGLETLGVEVPGRLMIADTGVTVKGRLDRVERNAAGQMVLIDYKSGAIPSRAQQKAYAKQLLVAAVMVENGGFPLPAPAEVGEIRFVPIKPDEGVVTTDLTFEIKDEVWNGLVKVLQFYRDEASGFTARRAMTKIADASRYDHLSRFGEWELSEPAKARRVGFGDDE